MTWHVSLQSVCIRDAWLWHVGVCAGSCRGPGPSEGPAGIEPCPGPYKYVNKNMFNIWRHWVPKIVSLLQEKRCSWSRDLEHTKQLICNCKFWIGWHLRPPQKTILTLYWITEIKRQPKWNKGGAPIGGPGGPLELQPFWHRCYIYIYTYIYIHIYIYIWILQKHSVPLSREHFSLAI